jgi:RNase P subunit RPR2
MTNPTYPEYKFHSDVICKTCNKCLAEGKIKAYGIKDAPWLKVCNKCNTCNWYNIENSNKEGSSNWGLFIQTQIKERIINE